MVTIQTSYCITKVRFTRFANLCHSHAILPFFALYENKVIAISVQGCADLATPDHAWDRRVGNTVTIGCTHYNKTWQLKCEGSEWIGSVGTCNASGWLISLISLWSKIKCEFQINPKCTSI